MQVLMGLQIVIYNVKVTAHKQQKEMLMSISHEV